MQSYTQFPPIKYFIRVLKNCPKSALIYIQVWEKRGETMRFVEDKESVRKDYLISPTMFRNLLLPLSALNLVCFVERAHEFEITVMGSNDRD